MECLTDTKIQHYVDGSLSSVENAMIRDHLITCQACSKAHEYYEALEEVLWRPVEMTPPAIIEQNVLRVLFPKLPTYSSILALIAASFSLLVTSIYIYFDFANNSLIRAFNLTSSSTTSWIGSVVRFISSFFSVVYTIFKAINRLINIFTGVNLGAELVGLTLFSVGLAGSYFILKATFKKLKIKI